MTWKQLPSEAVEPWVDDKAPEPKFYQLARVSAYCEQTARRLKMLTVLMVGIGIGLGTSFLPVLGWGALFGVTSLVAIWQLKELVSSKFKAQALTIELDQNIKLVEPTEEKVNT